MLIGLFLGISVVAGLLFHWQVRRYVLASALAAISADAAFQAITYVTTGSLHPYFPFVALQVGVYAFLIALLVGYPFKHFRHKPEG